MTYKGRLLGLLGVLTLAVAAGMPAQASVINYGVVPIGGTPSFTSPTGFLQDATIFNLGGGTDTVNLVSPGDASGLIPGSVVHITPQIINLVAFTPVVKTWSGFVETLTTVADINRGQPNALGFTLLGVVTGRACPTCASFVNTPIELAFSANQPGGPGHLVGWSNTDVTLNALVTSLPPSLPLFGAGLVGFGLLMRRRHQKP
jgi:hypothetical protein